jgi:hypothetical protein
MPSAVPVACSYPRCPGFAVPGGRGKCGRHRLSDAERGNGSAHRRERRAALRGARCEACGCVNLQCLQRDHRLPYSLGGSDTDPANKRWLCRSERHRCHDTYGARSDRPGRPIPGMGGKSVGPSVPQDSRPLLLTRPQVFPNASEVQSGRDACGIPLTGSLTVVRHRPSRRAEPDPNRPYKARLISGLSMKSR